MVIYNPTRPHITAEAIGDLLAAGAAVVLGEFRGFKVEAIDYTDKTTGENMTDPRGYSVLRAADTMLEKDHGMSDRQDRLDAMVDINAMARDYYATKQRTKTPETWEMSLRRAYDTWEKQHKKPKTEK